MKPRLLFVSPRFLFPLDQGGKIRTASILARMKGGAFDVTLVSPGPGPGGGGHDSEIARVCDRFESWRASVPTRLGRLAALPGARPIPVASDQSAEGSAVVARALATRPDVVVVDFPHAAVLLPDRIDAVSVIFTHNVEVEIFERHAAIAKFPMRWLWQDQARKMRRFEGETLRRFDAVIAVSARDGERMRELYRLPATELIDTGVDLDFYPYTPPPLNPAEPVLVFSGAMDSRSNIDGVEFLIDEIWPRIVAARPGARAVIVGRNPPPGLVARAREFGAAFRFTGFVDDVRPEIEAATVSAIPLRVGSGTRMKAFEAMALGRPVVSTALGIEGLDITPSAHFLLADTAEEFARATLLLFDDPALRLRLAEAARARVEARFSWAHVARQFEAICLKALAG